MGRLAHIQAWPGFCRACFDISGSSLPGSAQRDRKRLCRVGRKMANHAYDSLIRPRHMKRRGRGATESQRNSSETPRLRDLRVSIPARHHSPRAWPAPGVEQSDIQTGWAGFSCPRGIKSWITPRGHKKRAHPTRLLRSSRSSSRPRSLNPLFIGSWFSAYHVRLRSHVGWVLIPFLSGRGFLRIYNPKIVTFSDVLIPFLSGRGFLPVRAVEAVYLLES